MSQKHTPLPFKYSQILDGIYSCPKENGYEPLSVVIAGSINQEDAAFIARACNGFPAWQDVADWISDYKNGLGPDISRLELALKNGSGE